MFSGGTFGVRVNKVGWGNRGLAQANGCGGDCRTSCGDGGPAQALMPLKGTSDLLGNVGWEGASSSVVELAREFPSYVHSLRELRHGAHGRPASHLYPHNPRSGSVPFRRVDHRKV